MQHLGKKFAEDIDTLDLYQEWLVCSRRYLTRGDVLQTILSAIKNDNFRLIETIKWIEWEDQYELLAEWIGGYANYKIVNYICTNTTIDPMLLMHSCIKRYRMTVFKKLKQNIAKEKYPLLTEVCIKNGSVNILKNLVEQEQVYPTDEEIQEGLRVNGESRKMMNFLQKLQALSARNKRIRGENSR